MIDNSVYESQFEEILNYVCNSIVNKTTKTLDVLTIKVERTNTKLSKVDKISIRSSVIILPLKFIDERPDISVVGSMFDCTGDFLKSALKSYDFTILLSNEEKFHKVSTTMKRPFLDNFFTSHSEDNINDEIRFILNQPLDGFLFEEGTLEFPSNKTFYCAGTYIDYTIPLTTIDYKSLIQFASFYFGINIFFETSDGKTKELISVIPAYDYFNTIDSNFDVYYSSDSISFAAYFRKEINTKSYVNGIETKDGGIHIKAILDAVNKKTGKNFNNDDLKIICSYKTFFPVYSGFFKDRLIRPKPIIDINEILVSPRIILV